MGWVRCAALCSRVSGGSCVVELTWERSSIAAARHARVGPGGLRSFPYARVAAACCAQLAQRLHVPATPPMRTVLLAHLQSPDAACAVAGRRAGGAAHSPHHAPHSAARCVRATGAQGGAVASLLCAAVFTACAAYTEHVVTCFSSLFVSPCLSPPYYISVQQAYSKYLHPMVI